MKKILNNKNIILIPINILLLISIFVLKDNNTLLIKQSIFLILLNIEILLFKNINIKWLINKSTIIYIINILLLILVLFIGKQTNGSRAWLNLHYFKIQPNEFMKFSLLIYLLKLIQEKKNYIILLIVFIIPSLLTYLEPDTGSIIIYSIIFITTLLLHKNYRKWALLTILILMIILITSLILYLDYKDIFVSIFGNSIFYRIDRIISFKEQNNIQIQNALISIGSHNFLYFPEYHNDFIFAYILSKYNILLTIVILINYLILFKILTNKLNKYSVPLLLILLFLTFQNIFMNLGLLPIIGIPLPFLSYGGSYIISLGALIGLFLNSKDNNMVLEDMVDMDL